MEASHRTGGVENQRAHVLRKPIIAGDLLSVSSMGAKHRMFNIWLQSPTSMAGRDFLWDLSFVANESVEICGRVDASSVAPVAETLEARVRNRAFLPRAMEKIGHSTG
jgi:hypothetical protein